MQHAQRRCERSPKRSQMPFEPISRSSKHIWFFVFLFNVALVIYTPTWPTDDPLRPPDRPCHLTHTTHYPFCVSPINSQALDYAKKATYDLSAAGLASPSITCKYHYNELFSQVYTHTDSHHRTHTPQTRHTHHPKKTKPTHLLDKIVVGVDADLRGDLHGPLRHLLRVQPFHVQQRLGRRCWGF